MWTILVLELLVSTVEIATIIVPFCSSRVAFAVKQEGL